jgi:hypothetical protein
MEPLERIEGLSLASRDHVKDIAETGKVTCTGTDGSNLPTRVERYGRWGGGIAENISKSKDSGHDIVLDMIIDGWDPNKGQRKNMFSAKYLVVGIGCMKNKKEAGNKWTCVVDVACSYKNNEGVKEKFEKETKMKLKDENTEEQLNMIESEEEKPEEPNAEVKPKEETKPEADKNTPNTPEESTPEADKKAPEQTATQPKEEPELEADIIKENSPPKPDTLPPPPAPPTEETQAKAKPQDPEEEPEPPKYSGKLTIFPKKAKLERNADVFSAMDPYVIFKIDGQ